MRKIVSLFQRNYDGDRLVRDEVVPGAEWVLDGEGVATRKWDGTCCLIEGGRLFKRHDVKKGKTPPPGFVPAQEPDVVTGHWPGWVEVGDGPEDRWHREALLHDDASPADYAEGTYELIGPKVQGNPENVACHMLMRHGTGRLTGAPRTFDALREYLASDMEGIVWHRDNGDMVKIKAKDFGIKR
jgi:hypothetical protein